MRALTIGLIFSAACGAVAKPPPAGPATTSAAANSSATASAPPAGPASAACAIERRRDFDFWLGTWEVRNPEGEVVGHNRIEAIYGGCAVRESWTSSDGGGGSSVSVYDASKKKWRQLWVDGYGGIVEFEGERSGPAMVFLGTTVQPDGTTARVRGTWTGLPDGTVRQIFEQAGPNADDAGAWKVTFDGRYARTR
jgi:hypothetical protein